MSLPMQARVLELLEEGTFRRSGGLKAIRVNVRIVAATHRNLKRLVQEGKFREDLFYRMNVVHLFLPPLREREEDIPWVVDSLLQEIAWRRSEKTKRVSAEAVRVLTNYRWPGNLRELEGELERAVREAPGELIGREHLSARLAENPWSDGEEWVRRSPRSSLKEIKRRVTEAIERTAIVEGLRTTSGNKSACAKLLQISRVDLLRKIAKYGLGKEKIASEENWKIV